MPRNPNWTAQNAALITSLYGALPTTQFSASNLGGYETSTGTVTTSAIAVNLKASAAYSITSMGQYTTDISIYDSQGYLLSLTSMFDKYGFRPESDGKYIIVVSWVYVPSSSSGWKTITLNEDAGANGVNDRLIDNLKTIYSSVLRVDKTSTLATDFAKAKIDVPFGQNTNLVAATAEAVQKADATTSVASMSYQFFTGKIPGLGGVDYLVSATGPNPNNLNSAYYQSFNLENRYINFAVNLGKVGEGNAKFTAEYGSLSLFDATKKAYAVIFGGVPTDAKVHALIDTRVDYFASYGGDGATGIGTKAAMVGWLLAEATKADVGVLARSNMAWLTDLSDGSAPFAVDILDPTKGYYKTDFIFGGA